MQPMYRMHEFVTRNGAACTENNTDIPGQINDVGADIFHRGLCLPSDIKMTEQEQDQVIQIIRSCFA